MKKKVDYWINLSIVSYFISLVSLFFHGTKGNNIFLIFAILGVIFSTVSKWKSDKSNTTDKTE